MSVKTIRGVVHKPTPETIQQKPASERWNGDILSLKRIGLGASGLVLVIDESRVIKVSFGSKQSIEEIETERRAYRILKQAKKPSSYILQCFDADDPRGLILERCQHTVRRRLRSLPKAEKICDTEARRWARQAAEGLAFAHRHEIIHADVGCHNMLLTPSNVLKLCDFAGSSVRGSPASTTYEDWSRFQSDDVPTRMTDIFALGSAIYEMSTKEPPYQNKLAAEVLDLHQKGRFSSVKKVASLGNVITNCWTRKYSDASEIVQEIDPQYHSSCDILEDPVEEEAATSHGTASGAPTLRSPSSSSSSVRSSNASSSSTRTSTSWPEATEAPTASFSKSSTPQLPPFRGRPERPTNLLTHDHRETKTHSTGQKSTFNQASNRGSTPTAGKLKRPPASLLRWLQKSLPVRHRASP